MKKACAKKLLPLIIIAIALVAFLTVFYVIRSGYFSVSNYTRVDFDKYFELADYDNLTYKEEVASVSDSEVQEQISSNVSDTKSESTVTSGTVASGDTLTISYEGKIDGESFSGGSSSSSSITIGSGSYIDGFEEGLIGKQIGSTVTLNLTFPSDYNQSSLAGKDVVFTVTIKSKTVTTTPTYNLDWVKENTDYDTIEDYEKIVYDDLLKEKQEDNESAAKQDLFDTVVENTTVDTYPKKQLSYEKKQFKKQYENLASSYGITLDDFISSSGMTDDEFDENIETYAKDVVKQKMICYALAEKEGLSVSYSEYVKYLKSLLKDNGYTKTLFKKSYGESIYEYGEEQNIRYQLLLEKVEDMLKEKNTSSSSSDSSSSSSSSSESK